ncbi:MAG: hypothetical protein ACYDBY_06895 [Thermoanaerobaculia bacterium]
MGTPRDAMRVDRTAFDVVPLDGQDDDLAYWLARSVDERLEAIEVQRQVIYGYDPATDRLRRVLEVAPLERG